MEGREHLSPCQTAIKTRIVLFQVHNERLASMALMTLSIGKYYPDFVSPCRPIVSARGKNVSWSIGDPCNGAEEIWPEEKRKSFRLIGTEMKSLQ